MAVEVVYRSSRDPERLFMDKAEADRHDKMLELAERLSSALHRAVPSLSDEQGEELGIFMQLEDTTRHHLLLLIFIHF